MNWKSGPKIRPQGFILTKAEVMDWKSVSKSGLNTLHYLGPDGRTRAGLWAELKANPASPSIRPQSQCKPALKRPYTIWIAQKVEVLLFQTDWLDHCQIKK